MPAAPPISGADPVRHRFDFFEDEFKSLIDSPWQVRRAAEYIVLAIDYVEAAELER